MDQRAKGGPSPPSTSPLLPLAPPGQHPEKEGGGGKRKRREKEEGSAVLEVLIEGHCGTAGQSQLPFPGRERSCSEGNVRLRIGVQTAKRTKKPPRTLEGYECVPPIKTHQRPGRGPVGRGGQEGGGSGQGNSPWEKGDGGQNQGSDPYTNQTKNLDSASTPPLASSSSTTTTPPITAPSSSDTQTLPGKRQVPAKLAHETERKSDTSPGKLGYSDLPGAHSKLPSPAQTNQATPSDPTSSSPHSPLPSSPRSPFIKDPSDEKVVGGDGGMLNGGVPVVTCRPTRLTKVKGRKQDCSSTPVVTNMNSTRPQASSPHQSDPAAQHRTTSPRCPLPPAPTTPLLQNQPGTPVADGIINPATSQGISCGALLQSSVGNDRVREEKAKKKKEKHDKVRVEKGKGERRDKGKGKEGQVCNESPKKDRCETEKERTGLDWRGNNMTGKEEGEGERDKEKEKPKDVRVMNKSPSTKCQPLSEVQSRKPGTPGPDPDPDRTRGSGESDDPDSLSRPVVPPFNSTASNSSPLTACPPPPLLSSSPPTSPQEQDSRPLKKRKTRRQSWTRLVNRAQRLAENPDAPPEVPVVAPLTPSTPHKPSTTTPPNSPSAESRLATFAPLPLNPSPLSTSTSTPAKPRPAGRPQSPTQTHLSASDPSSPPVPDCPASQARKRGRPKSQMLSTEKTPPRCSLRPEVHPGGHGETPDRPVVNPVLDLSPTLTSPSGPNFTPRKRGRPKRQPSSLASKQTFQDLHRRTLSSFEGKKEGRKRSSEKGNGKLRSIMGEMKRRKRRLLREMLSRRGGGEEGRGGEGGGETSRGGTGGVSSSLTSCFGGNLGPQINVSKRGTIYMGKRRGRKPKAPVTSACQFTLLHSLPGPSPFPSSQPHPPLTHPFPSPSLTHSSGAQSPYSDGGFTEPAPSLFLPHPFSLPSPSSSCASPRPLSSFSSSSSLSPSLKRSSAGQGRQPLFHHPSGRLSSLSLTHPHPSAPPHQSISPAHLKESTPSLISQSHCEETLPRDSRLGFDSNSISERGERRSGGRGKVGMGMNSEVTRSVFRSGLGVSLKGQRHQPPSKLLEHLPPVLSPLRLSDSPPSPPSASPRHTHPVTPPSAFVEPRDRHRHGRASYQGPYTCPSCPPCAPCPCLGHKAPKRQKHKRKRKYQHLLMHAQDPDFLSELDDLIGQFSEVRIGRHRDWARAGLGRKLDESGGNATGGKRRHSSPLSSHHFRSNVYRINLSGYYSPHPISYPPHPSFSPLPPHPCHLCGSRKPGRRLKCGCPTKPCQPLDQGDCAQGQRCPLQGNTGYLHPSSLSTPLSSPSTPSTSMPLGLGYYRGYPLSMAHYQTPPHPSYSLPPPYASHQPHLHHPHLLLNPARFHRRRSRQLREGGVGRRDGGGEEVGGRAGVGSCPGALPGLSCVCGGADHKLRHKHRHRPRDWVCERKDEEGVVGSRQRSEFTVRSAEGGSRTGGQGSGGLMESPWQRRYGKDLSSFSSAATKQAFSSSSSPSSARAVERLKHPPLSCLGSTHLSSFGEGLGGQLNPWLRNGGLGAGFRPPTTTLGTLTGGQRSTAVAGSEREEGDSLTSSHGPRHSTFTPLTNTNLFTSSTNGRSMGNGRASSRPSSQDVSLRREELSQKEKRSTGPHPDLNMRTCQSVGAKRGPGRPRKNPLLSPTAPPNPLTEAHHHNGDRNRGSGGASEGGREDDTVQEVIEAVIRKQKRRGRKRRRVEQEEEEEEEEDPPCFHSSGEGEPVTHTPSICTGQSELSLASSVIPASQSDEEADQPPMKRFQRAGLYSDDFKTTDPSCHTQLNTEMLEYIPGEQDYRLLPAPIHVGKYLRMRRIDFQLPYDVMWLWSHNQLHKKPEVPLSREISPCQPKEKSLSVPPSPSAQEECFSPRKKLLFPHLDMEPMSTRDRVFVLKHHVFLLRNWEWVRDRQMQLRRGGQGGPQKDTDRNGGGLSSIVATGDSYIKPGGTMGVKEKVVLTSVDLHEPRYPPNTPETTSCLHGEPNRRKEQERNRQKEVRNDMRKERLNSVLLKLRHTLSGGTGKMRRRGDILVQSLFFHQVA
ncbi:histone-lysine N-methyltransferase ASH1L isoform X1 [Esox lucius]|uniref:Histone-lysine N-methyltransferase ASH1L-like n=1 Tax=Esox lucius TaxID=8010 RepID=A0AAY5KP55_ESOLU|nr:histone-lysine N-methyltransferase ASH1L isoform X1 [Esox lucius]XP_012994837.2 histone-lysine N-methyltransferase ASH1L isoform X1 [Esox lucius]XP_012994838.2 histone-lysine N-methyltransferase ASH1L isoform X1 [Esox lucius]XP_012994839.2 histone-lysine N-methyltransferase ASH1L isoform X1 [Esox lucius]